MIPKIKSTVIWHWYFPAYLQGLDSKKMVLPAYQFTVNINKKDK